MNAVCRRRLWMRRLLIGFCINLGDGSDQIEDCLDCDELRVEDGGVFNMRHPGFTELISMQYVRGVPAAVVLCAISTGCADDVDVSFICRAALHRFTGS